MNGIASFISEAISDAEKRVKTAIQEGQDYDAHYYEGVLNALIAVEECIANQENDE